jgi:hypothetical protein
MRARFIIAVLVISFQFHAGDLRISAWPPSLEVLPGEPMPLEVSISNQGKKVILVPGESVERGLDIQIVLIAENGKTVDCSGITPHWVGAQGPQGDVPSKLVEFSPGASISHQDVVGSQQACPLAATPPGRYVARIQASLWSWQTDHLGKAEGSLDLPVTIKTPQGEDAEVLKALEAERARYDAGTKNAAMAGEPLRWDEVRHSPRFKSGDIILSKFPGSNYAGYFLWQRVPSEARWDMSVLNDADGHLRRWCDRGGGEANTQAHLSAARQSMVTYAKKAAAFLQAHPDYAYNHEIRRGYAMSLGLTGRMSEALVEVEILAKGLGKEADEARAFLESRKAGKESKPPEAAKQGTTLKEPLASTPPAAPVPEKTTQAPAAPVHADPSLNPNQPPGALPR